MAIVPLPLIDELKLTLAIVTPFVNDKLLDVQNVPPVAPLVDDEISVV